MKVDQKNNSSRVDGVKENIYSNFEILMISTTDDDDHLRKTKPFYKYYEPILNSMLGELCNKGAGSSNECFINYNLISRWVFRKLEYSFILEHVFNNLGRKDKILDLGGGITPLSNVFSGDERKCVLIDNSPFDAIFMHRNNNRIYGKECAFHCVDMTDLIYDDNQFHFVISVSVLEHFDSIKSIRKAIKEAFRVLKPGGKLVCTWSFQHNPSGMDLSPDNFKTVVSRVLMPFSQEVNPDIHLPSDEEIRDIWKKYWFPLCKYDFDNVPKWTALAFCLTKEGEKDNLEDASIKFRKDIDGKFFDNELLYLPKEADRLIIKMKYFILNNTFTWIVARKVRKVLKG